MHRSTLYAHALPKWAVRRNIRHLLETDASRGQGNARRRKGDCKGILKRSRGNR